MEEKDQDDLKMFDTSTRNAEIELAEKKKENLKELFSWIRVIVLAVVVALFLNHFVIVNATIPSGSMENTIMTGDRIIGFRLSYLFSEPQRGDIIIFRFPDDESQLFIKRIIGLPGDTVNIVNGRVYINGSDTPLDEPYVNGTPLGTFGTYTVPEDSYFMMGDNRNDSWDSRFWTNTFVTRKQIQGKAIFQYWPRIGGLN